MTRRLRQPRAWERGLLFLTLLVALALVAPPSATIAAPAYGSGEPPAAVLTATIERFLVVRAAHITGEHPALDSQSLALTNHFQRQAESMFAVLDGRREVLRQHKIHYTRPEIHALVGRVDRVGDSLSVSATEWTKLHFRKVTGDEPDFTAYREDHLFTFELAAGEWLLALQRPLPATAVPAVTEAMDFVVADSSMLADPDASSIEYPTGRLPTAKSTVAQPGELSVAAIPLGLDYTAMVNYAVKYWDNYNSAYRSFAGSGGDCTNFISQVLHEGGWAFKLGLWFDDSNWWYSELNQTRSWAGAENWSHFAPQRTTYLSNIWQMSIADILQLDFDKDGIMDHSMVLTKKTSTEIYMTYHTSDTLNRPLSELQALYGNSAWWYAYRT